MFEDQIVKRFKALEAKAMKRISKSSKALNAGAMGAVDVILAGLRKEVAHVIKSVDDLNVAEGRIGQAFDLSRNAVSKLMLASDVKSGSKRLTWLTYALKGIEQPKEKPTAAAKSSDDELPIWLREKE